MGSVPFKKEDRVSNVATYGAALVGVVSVLPAWIAIGEQIEQ